MNTTNDNMNNKKLVKISVLRSTDGQPGNVVAYNIPLDHDMTILQALDYIYRKLDPDLGFKRYCCGVQLCGSCLMMINGHAAYACKTKIEESEYLLEPLRGYRIIRDLITGEKLSK